jgi:hypothetical protein
MEQMVTPTKKSFSKWILPYSISVTFLHTAAIVSWFVLFNLTPELDPAEQSDLYSQYWIIPEIIGGSWFSGILLLLSLSVVIIAGRIVDQGKSSVAIIVLVLNLCFILMSGWSLL